MPQCRTFRPANTSERDIDAQRCEREREISRGGGPKFRPAPSLARLAAFWNDIDSERVTPRLADAVAYTTPAPTYVRASGVLCPPHSVWTGYDQASESGLGISNACGIFFYFTSTIQSGGKMTKTNKTRSSSSRAVPLKSTGRRLRWRLTTRRRSHWGKGRKPCGQILTYLSCPEGDAQVIFPFGGNAHAPGSHTHTPLLRNPPYM